MEEEKKELLDSLKEKVKEPLKQIEENGIDESNVDYTYRLIDIYKDIQEIKCKEDFMRYGRNYGNEYGDSSYNYGNNSYGRRGVPGTGRRYSAGGNYGARGYDSKYRGDEMMENMYQGYREYSDGKEMYGADNKTMESYEYMLKSMKDFYKHLMKEASSEEEVQMLQQTIQEMANM